ncbi:MAG: NADH-quinone oxidoreductase subunit NuoG [Betaproteobacteria bacterium]
MVEIQLDGNKVEVPEGSTVMHAAEKAGTYIPHFCYHKKLSIAANCRMCLVDVEKAPKPMPACATPVTQGMVVHTKSDKAIKAQKSVMEFLLINHPLDCPICDQGGECQLQDLAVGYGGSGSRYQEEKRVVLHKDVGPLISMEEMSRCIHCTRCVRFGQEVAGAMELGMSHRGEHSEIETFVGMSVDSELSGNMIDICPVGALTSKPFRYSARTWELSRRKSISPHDSTGANLVVQVKHNQVMRVLPLENDAVNECWIADRDRFSYEALNGDQRLSAPMIKQGGQWKEVDWQTALEYVANGLKQIGQDHGPASLGALVSPHSTLEELYLAGLLMRRLGSDNIDHRLRHAQFPSTQSVRWLGTSLASLSSLQSALIIGSNLRKDHPLMALRLRQAARSGAKIMSINSLRQLPTADAWAIPVSRSIHAEPAQWQGALHEVAAALAQAQGLSLPAGVSSGPISETAQAMAQALVSGQRKAILLGNAAAHHAQASNLLAVAGWIAEHTGASVGYLGEAANTVGAQWVGSQPQSGGLHAGQMLAGSLKAALLLGTEPVFDSAAGLAARQGLAQAQMVVSLNAFKANMDLADVLLPIAPFTETPGTFVNAEGRVQGFHAVVKPLGQARPAWKVLRVLGQMLGLAGFEAESAGEVLSQAIGAATAEGARFVPADALSNAAHFDAALASVPVGEPATAAIYQLDGIVRRAPSLQLTADARAGGPAQLHEQEVSA